jgi:hypothetical protein
MRYPIRSTEQVKSAIDSLQIMPSLGMVFHQPNMELTIHNKTVITAEWIIEHGYIEFEFYILGGENNAK